MTNITSLSTSDGIAVFSDDRDYLDLMWESKRRGVATIGVCSNRESFSEEYGYACDKIIFFSDYVDSCDTQELKRVLVQAYMNLEKRNVITVGATLVPEIRRLIPDFEISDYGYENFRELCLDAHTSGLVRHQPQGNDILIRLTEQGRFLGTEHQSHALQELPVEPPSSLTIPNIEHRTAIYKEIEQLLWIYRQTGIQLCELSDQVCENVHLPDFSKDDMEQVFRILHQNGVFEVIETQELDNPWLASLYLSQEQMDDVVLKQVANTIEHQNSGDDAGAAKRPFRLLGQKSTNNSHKSFRFA